MLLILNYTKMKLSEIKKAKHRKCNFPVAKRHLCSRTFHVTEVGLIRSFIDCGGKVRNETSKLQLWMP
jgi:hypothetical protein